METLSLSFRELGSDPERSSLTPCGTPSVVGAVFWSPEVGEVGRVVSEVGSGPKDRTSERN